jgi:hypothetical protein
MRVFGEGLQDHMLDTWQKRGKLVMQRCRGSHGMLKSDLRR